MAHDQKDPYQYERLLRQQVQQAFSGQQPGASRPGGQRPGGEGPLPKPPKDPAEELVRSLHELGQSIAQEVGSALNEAAGDIRQSVRPAKPPRQAAQYGARARGAGDALAARVNQASANLSGGLRDGLCIFGGTLAVCGAVALGFFSLMLLVSTVLMALDPLTGLDVALVTGVLAAAGLGATAALGLAARWAFAQPGRRLRLRRYMAAMGSERVVPVARLAEAVQRPVPFVKKELVRMLRQGWLPGAFYDEQEQVFFASAEEYRRLQRRQEAAARAETAQNAPKTTQSELAELLQQCSDFDLLLGQHILATKEQPELCAQLEHMRKVTGDIQSWVKAHPQSAGKVRKFARYYMPTTLKLLRTYDDVKHQQGQAAGNIRQEIGGILQTLNLAFDNLHNDLLSDTALDISSEISAMQAMLAQDGLTSHDSP